MSVGTKLLKAAAGNAAGGGAVYVDDVFSTFVYEGNGAFAKVIENGMALANGPANGTVLHLTGDNLTDSSPVAKTVTNNNSVSVSTSVKKYGTGSLQFDGVDQYLSIASSEDFNFGADDFTIEGWFYAQSDSDDRGAIFELYADEDNMMRVMINTGDVLELRLRSAGSQVFNITTTSWSYNTWHHFAAVNNGGTINFYLDGTSVGSNSSFTIPNFSSAQVLVGVDLYATDRWYTGYIDDLRVTNNKAIYTANFTPPSAALSLDTLVEGKGGLVWIKNRDDTDDHVLADTARGADSYLSSNTTSAVNTSGNVVRVFNSDGFTVGNASTVNTSAEDYASWTFRKQAGFFDIQTWSGNGTAGRVISHDLGSVPGMIIIKCTNTVGEPWYVYHRETDSSAPEDYHLKLNSSNARSDSDEMLNDTAPTSTGFTVTQYNSVNGSGKTYVAYLFAHDAQDFGEDSDEAIIKCGSYTGNGNTDGPTVTLGFEPQWLMIRGTGGGDWQILDNMRGISSGGTNDARLLANTTAAEYNSIEAVQLQATGFKIDGTTGGAFNGSGNNYIYVAIRRPNKPASEFAATDLFTPAPGLNASANGKVFATTYPVDLSIATNRPDSGVNWYTFDRMRGGGEYLWTDSTQAEASIAYQDQFDHMDGLYTTNAYNYSSPIWIGYEWRRAKGFFDVVAYTGTGSSGLNITHNLGVAPELIIAKQRNGTNAGVVYNKTLTASKYLFLFYNFSTDPASSVDTGVWNGTEPTESVFTVGSYNNVNLNGGKYIAYLFATVAGISKIGTYTGTQGTLNVDCGFSAGARFVLVKRTDNNGDWYVWDSTRGIVAGNDPYKLLNSTAAEVTNTDYIDPLSSGFTINSSAPAALNATGGTYIFLAIA